jgi:hypothetical protein
VKGTVGSSCMPNLIALHKYYDAPILRQALVRSMGPNHSGRVKLKYAIKVRPRQLHCD